MAVDFIQLELERGLVDGGWWIVDGQRAILLRPRSTLYPPGRNLRSRVSTLGGGDGYPNLIFNLEEKKEKRTVWDVGNVNKLLTCRLNRSNNHIARALFPLVWGLSFGFFLVLGSKK